MKKTLVSAALPLLMAGTVSAEQVRYDLDDVRQWKMVSMETCLDAALDTIPGKARKLELKIEDATPVYEFDIEATADQQIYNVECNAEKGLITEIEREVDKNNPVFKRLAKITEEQARETALTFHPGKVVAQEYELGFDGSATYQFDIESIHGYEIKVDIDAVTGKIEEANIELYEIGME